MLRGSLRSVFLTAWMLAQAAAQSLTGPAVLAIDTANSQVLIQVGKAGVFGFAGHAHEVAATDVRGRVTVDLADLQQSRVSLEFGAANLRVTGRGEPLTDVPAVQQVMMSDRVLDAARCPSITFSSRRVSVISRTAATAEVLIEGDMQLHAMTRPMSIRASVGLDAGGRLTARGAFVLKQTAFGMVPVTAAGGTVRVKDELDIQFVLRTRPSDDTRSTR